MSRRRTRRELLVLVESIESEGQVYVAIRNLCCFGS